MMITTRGSTTGSLMEFPPPHSPPPTASFSFIKPSDFKHSHLDVALSITHLVALSGAVAAAVTAALSHRRLLPLGGHWALFVYTWPSIRAHKPFVIAISRTVRRFYAVLLGKRFFYLASFIAKLHFWPYSAMSAVQFILQGTNYPQPHL